MEEGWGKCSFLLSSVVHFVFFVFWHGNEVKWSGHRVVMHSCVQNWILGFVSLWVLCLDKSQRSIYIVQTEFRQSSLFLYITCRFNKCLFFSVCFPPLLFVFEVCEHLAQYVCLCSESLILILYINLNCCWRSFLDHFLLLVAFYTRKNSINQKNTDIWNVAAVWLFCAVL